MRESTRTGRRFGRLVVIERIQGGANSRYLCQCDCGNHKEVLWDSLRKGRTKSCGCYRDEFIADLKRQKTERLAALPPKKEKGPSPTTHPLYQTWRGMIRRCYSADNDNFKHYGGRGITVCDRWKNDFWAFARDMGQRPDGTTLDRIDSAGNYEPINCRWADKLTQYSNMPEQPVYIATLKGRTMFMADWARELKCSLRAMQKLVKAGHSVEVAVVAALLRRKEYERTRNKGADYGACLEKARAWVAKNS